jgi:hypothetical protein
MDFEFIAEDDIQAVRRGRKSQVPQELVDALARLADGKAVVVKDYALDPKADDYKTAKASVSATIRQAGKQAGKQVSIAWSPAGVPQVKVRPVKAKPRKA